MELKLAVSDVILEQLRLEQTVELARALDPEGERIKGVISEISPYREPGSLPEIIITLDSNEVGPGVAVNAQLEIKAERGMAIPIRSVLMTGNNTVGVYRITDGIANLVPIRPLSITTNSVVIDQGLEPGDALAVEGLQQLFDGAKVIEAQTKLVSEAQ